MVPLPLIVFPHRYENIHTIHRLTNISSFQQMCRERMTVPVTSIQSTILLHTFFSLLLSFPRPHHNLLINFLFQIFLKTPTGTYPHQCPFHGHADMTKADRSSLTFLHSPSRRTRSECQIINIPTCQLSRVHKVPISKQNAGSLMPRPPQTFASLPPPFY